MTRSEAAALLGVPDDCSPDDVRRAWRLWARLTHPDHGGDAQAFDHLIQARDVLLAAPRRDEWAVTARPSWGSVLVRPTMRDAVAVVVAAAIALMLAAVPAFVAVAVAALPAAIAAVACAWLTTYSLLTTKADRGQRVVVALGAWTAIVAGQLLVSTAVGASLLPLLPLLAVPLVAVVSLVLAPAGGLLRAGGGRIANDR